MSTEPPMSAEPPPSAESSSSPPKPSPAPESRRRLNVLSGDYFPAYVVWELTLACDHACAHCGSRGAVARAGELSTAEALQVADELAALGTREIVLIGGEAYLHEGFYEITRRLKARGVNPIVTTGGWGITEEVAAQMAAAGVHRVSVSIDGLEAQHDRIRAKRGSFQQCLRALEWIKRAGMIPQANTNFNRVNFGDLEELYLLLLQRGVKSWQVQITSPLGRAADRPQMLLQPYDLLDLMPRLARIKARGHAEGMLVTAGNNLGYFGPEESLLRSVTPENKDHWAGCQAGRFVMGIESDGAVKGCPSLQTKSYVGGRYREARAHSERPIESIWRESPELAFARSRSRADLWGYCAECPLAETCLGGCSFTAHSFFGRPGNNPMCHFRAIQHKKRGLRERLVRRARAPGEPFDHAFFEIVTEAFDAPEEPPHSLSDLVSIRG